MEADRHHVTLPRAGTIRTNESTRKLARRIEAGTARILSATVFQDWYGQMVLLVPGHRPALRERPRARRRGRAGGGRRRRGESRFAAGGAAPDGVRQGGSWPRSPWPPPRPGCVRCSAGPPAGKATGTRKPGPGGRRRNAGPGQAGTSAAPTPAPPPCAATRCTRRRRPLVQQHQVITVETLNASGMRSAGGARKRGLNRALADAALAEVRRMLGCKCTGYGSTLVEAGRYYPSSKLCSACGRRKPNLTLADRIYKCGHCGLEIDRDLNAAVNLARLGETRLGEQSPAGSGPVAGRGATRETEPARAGDAGGRETSTPRRQPPGKTGTASPQGEAA